VRWSSSQARCGRSVFLYWARAEERCGLKREYRFYTILEVLQCGEGSNMAQYMPFQPVLDAFAGNLKIVGTGASTANQRAPHFADDAVSESPILGHLSEKSRNFAPTNARCCFSRSYDEHGLRP